jgi:hypothetical protein
MSWWTNPSGAGFRLRFWLLWWANPSRARRYWWFYRRLLGHYRWLLRYYRWLLRYYRWLLRYYRWLFRHLGDDGRGYRCYRRIYRIYRWILWINGICWGHRGINRIHWCCRRIGLLTGRCHRRADLLLAGRHWWTNFIACINLRAGFLTRFRLRTPLIAGCHWWTLVIPGTCHRLISILGNR